MYVNLSTQQRSTLYHELRNEDRLADKHVESNEEQLLPVYFQPANPGDLQRHGFVPRKVGKGKRGFVLFIKQDLDAQRKIDAREAGGEGGEGGDVF